MRSLELSSHTDGDVAVVAATGSIDAVTTLRFTEALEAEIEAGRTQLVADLSAVDYISSAGLRTILAVVKRVREGGGDLRVSGAQPAVRKVFELSGFTSIVRFFDRAGDAAASYA